MPSPKPEAQGLNLPLSAVPSEVTEFTGRFDALGPLMSCTRGWAALGSPWCSYPWHRVTHTQEGFSEKRAVILQKTPQFLSPRNARGARRQLCHVPWQEQKCQWPFLPSHPCRQTPSHTEVSCQVEEGHWFVTTLLVSLDSNTACPIFCKKCQDANAQRQSILSSFHFLLSELENTVRVKGF